MKARVRIRLKIADVWSAEDQRAAIGIRLQPEILELRKVAGYVAPNETSG
jgi:hypothetical protein